jgi:hypothetical protein
MSSYWKSVVLPQIENQDYKACFSYIRGDDVRKSTHIMYQLPNDPLAQKLVRLAKRVTDPGDFSILHQKDFQLALVSADNPANYVLGVINLLRLCQEGHEAEGAYTKDDLKAAWPKTAHIKNPLHKIVLLSTYMTFNSNHRTFNRGVLATDDAVAEYVGTKKKLRELYTGQTEKLLKDGHGYTLPTYHSWGLKQPRGVYW